MPTFRIGCLAAVAAVAVGAWAPVALAQPSVGEKVYATVAPSIFVLETYGSDGLQNGSATGFLVRRNQLLTNAHVSDAGRMKVRLGPVAIDCETVRVDRQNDLALCQMRGNATIPALRLAAAMPAPGATVYAIGNPKGLEKTISEGLFTGLREVAGRPVAQISAAISPGSSGGPVVNVQGELIGVAVSSIVGGQALNLAVPLSAVRVFLDGKGAAADVASVPRSRTAPPASPAGGGDEIYAAAERGEAWAQAIIGILYDMAKQYTDAATWYRKAAEQGDDGGAFGLAGLYKAGQGVPQDYGEAARWARVAAEPGNTMSAMGAFMLATLYRDGLGVRKDAGEGVRWARQAANRDCRALTSIIGAAPPVDCALAQLFLAGHYQLGEGAPKDYVLAYMWANLAAAALPVGSQQKVAVDLRAALTQAMTPQQVEEAQRLSREWKPVAPK